MRSLQRRETTSWIQNSPFHYENFTYQHNLRCFFTPIRWPVILIRRPKPKRRNYLSVWRPWRSVIPLCFVRHQPSSLKPFWDCESIHFWSDKALLLFHQKNVLCCLLIFFHVKLRQPCFDQTQKRCVSVNSFSKFVWGGKPS